MSEKEKQLYEQVLVYANDFFRWDGRAEFSAKIDDQLSTLPKQKRESLLNELIDENNKLLQNHSDELEFLLQNRNTAIKNIVAERIKKIGIEKIGAEFEKLEKTDSRMQELCNEISFHLQSFDSNLQKYYERENHLSKERFPESIVSPDVISIIELFRKQMEKELPMLKKAYKDIEDVITQNSDSIFDDMKTFIEKNRREIKKPQDEQVETQKGLCYINPTNVLIDQIKHGSYTIQLKLREKSESARLYFTKQVFIMLLTSSEITRIERLIAAIDKRDILHKKLDITSSGGTTKSNSIKKDAIGLYKDGATTGTLKLRWNGSKLELLNIFRVMIREEHPIFRRLLRDVSDQEIKDFVAANFYLNGQEDIKTEKTDVLQCFNFYGDTSSLVRFFYYLTIRKTSERPYLEVKDKNALIDFFHRGFKVRNKKEEWEQMKKSTLLKCLGDSQSFARTADAIQKKEKEFKNKTHGLIDFLAEELIA